MCVDITLGYYCYRCPSGYLGNAVRGYDLNDAMTKKQVCSNLISTRHTSCLCVLTLLSLENIAILIDLVTLATLLDRGYDLKNIKPKKQLCSNDIITTLLLRYWPQISPSQTEYDIKIIISSFQKEAKSVVMYIFQ